MSILETQTQAMLTSVKDRPAQVIAISGGKGGIGKTNVSVNLAIALAKCDKRVMLLDADLGLANIDVLLGLKPKFTLEHVIDGSCSLEDVIIEGPSNIKIIPASSGTQVMTELTPLQHAGLINAFSDIQTEMDMLIIDVAAGISNSVVSFCRAAYEVILVVCDEPTSITDVYATIKTLTSNYKLTKFHVLANMVENEDAGYKVFLKLNRATEKFLDVTLSYIGAIPFDENLRKAVQKQKAVCQAYPSSRSSIAFKALANRVVDWPIAELSGDHNAFFIERLIDYSNQK